MKVVRYKNRKLYSMNLGRYITLRDVVEEVKKGRNVSVWDSSTKKDVTHKAIREALVAYGSNIPLSSLLAALKESA